MVGFGGASGLFADLAAGKAAGPFCAYDANNQGTLAGLNPALMQAGDQNVEKIVTAIKPSPDWKRERSAIFTVWDENDYSNQPNTNHVVMIVDANFGPHGVRSNTYYNLFSLLKTMEGALGLPCLNHACDKDTAAMTDLLGQRSED